MERKYRYFADLRHGSFIYVTVDGIGWPPVGYPVVELPEAEVLQYLNSEESYGISSSPWP